MERNVSPGQQFIVLNYDSRSRPPIYPTEFARSPGIFNNHSLETNYNAVASIAYIYIYMCVSARMVIRDGTGVVWGETGPIFYTRISSSAVSDGDRAQFWIVFGDRLET